MVGVVAFALPIVMLISTDYGNCYYDSISHFYYSRYTGDIFVGALFFIGGVMLAYRSTSSAETWMARLAGVCAFGVAVFPTSQPGCDGQSNIIGRAFVTFDTDAAGNLKPGSGTFPAEAFALFPSVEVFHLVFAGILFAILFIFCMFIFTIVHAEQRHGPNTLTEQKFRRNVVYVTSGFAILLAAGMIIANKAGAFDDRWWRAGNWMFRMEAVMLFAFGLSWLVKGRFGVLRHTAIGRWVDEGAALDARRKRHLEDQADGGVDRM